MARDTVGMDLARARYLTSGAGRAALAGIPPAVANLAPVALSTKLRKSFAAAEASALAEQLTLRAKAGSRLGVERAGFLLTHDGSEMMTHPLVAARRAARLSLAGAPVADLTCGLGGDLGAIAADGQRAASGSNVTPRQRSWPHITLKALTSSSVMRRSRRSTFSASRCSSTRPAARAPAAGRSILSGFRRRSTSRSKWLPLPSSVS